MLCVSSSKILNWHFLIAFSKTKIISNHTEGKLRIPIKTLQRVELVTVVFNFSLKFCVTITSKTYKAYNDRLPNILSDNIIKKRVSSYSTRTRDSLLVPRFSSRYMKDSVAYSGSILWNTVTNKHNDLVKTRYSDLRWKL